MIDFKEITLEDKPLFDRYLANKNYENSEYTFTNLFIWRHAYHFRYAVIKDALCIQGNYRSKLPLIFPPFGVKADDLPGIMDKLDTYFDGLGTPYVLKAVTEAQKNQLEAGVPERITFKPDRNNFDYVYSSQDLLELTGKKFRQKRNHLNKFRSSYQFDFEPIDDTNIGACIDTAESWAENRLHDEGIQEEQTAIMEAFRNFDILAIKGGALRINGSIQAFSLGELMSPQMAVIHIEKANTEYHGCFAAINQQFVEHCWQEVPLINREEDMGIPGLRKAKESYHPVKMVIKYTGFLR